MIADASAEIERREARARRLKEIRGYHRSLMRRSDTLLEELEKLNKAGRIRTPEDIRNRVKVFAAEAQSDEVIEPFPVHIQNVLDLIFRLQNKLNGSPDDDDGD